MVAAHIIAHIISLHIAENTREFKLIIFTVVSKTSFKLSGIPLAARASRWMLQCTQVALGATACMLITTPLCLPVMAFAPSVQIPTYLDHQSPFDVSKLSSTLKISSPVVLASSGLQKRMSSFIDPHKHNGHIPGAVPGPPRLLTHPAVAHRIHWLVCKAVIVSKHLLPGH